MPEEAYYETIKTAIEALWQEEGYDTSHFYVENTSRRDSKIEGPWTRPDLTLVSYRKFSWTMGTEFDVVIFEIKRPDSANVLAGFEALSHVTAATRGYVVFPIDADAWRATAPQLHVAAQRSDERAVLTVVSASRVVGRLHSGIGMVSALGLSRLL